MATLPLTQLRPAQGAATARRLSLVLRGARRAPLTLGLLATMALFGVLTGSIHHSLLGTPLLDQVGFGLPALRHGQVYTLLANIPFALFPWMLVTIGLMVIILLLPYEVIAGTRRALLVFGASQLGGYLLAVLLVAWPLDALGSGWGHYLATSRDVGPSAGAFGATAALVWHLPRRLRLPAGLALFLYLGSFLVTTHRIWDVEHLFAASIGLTVGARLKGEAITVSLPRRRSFHALRSTPRLLIAGLVALVGLLNVLWAFNPHLAARFEQLAANPLPFALVEGTTTLSVLTGLALILLGRGLLHGRRAAWLATMMLMPAPTVVHLLTAGHVVPRALAIRAILLALLLLHRRDFRARADVVTLRRAVRIAGGALALLPVYAALGFTLLRGAFAQPLTLSLAAHETLARMLFLGGPLAAGDGHSQWFLDSISIAWAGVLVYAAVALLRPVLRPTVTTDGDSAVADALLRAWGATGVAYMTSWPGNVRLLNGARDAYLAYRLIGGVALVLGDPVGSPEGGVRVIDEFVDICAQNGWTPAFYAVTPRYLAEFARHGLAAIQVGEDTQIDLATLAFKGKAWQDVRTAINRAGREGISFRFIDPAGEPALVAQLWEIDAAWKAAKNLPEMGFTLGKLTEPLDPEVRIAAAVDATGQLRGFVTWLPIHASRGWVLDLMRRRDGGFPGVMEFLIAKSALAFQAEGYQVLSLATAPLARVTRGDEETRLLERALAVMGDKLDPFYNFNSLFEFKRKFQPTWAPVYLAYPGAASLPKIGYAIVRAYLPSVSPGDVRAIVAQGVSKGMPEVRRSVRPAFRRLTTPRSPAGSAPEPCPEPLLEAGEQVAELVG